MKEHLPGIISGILGLASTALGGKYLWEWLKNKDKKQLDVLNHQQDMEVKKFEAHLDDGSRTERTLRETIKKMSDQLQKHEARLNKLEDEKVKDAAKITKLEAELAVKEREIQALEDKINKARKYLQENGNLDPAIDLFLNLK